MGPVLCLFGPGASSKQVRADVLNKRRDEGIRRKGFPEAKTVSGTRSPVSAANGQNIPMIESHAIDKFGTVDKFALPVLSKTSPADYFLGTDSPAKMEMYLNTPHRYPPDGYPEPGA